jgi:hypothetical protein
LSPNSWLAPGASEEGGGGGANEGPEATEVIEEEHTGRVADLQKDYSNKSMDSDLTIIC